MNRSAVRERFALIGLTCILCALPLTTVNVNIHHVMIMFLIYASLGEA